MTALDFAADGKAAPRAEALAQWTRAVCALIFLSSFPALISQLAWQDALARGLAASLGASFGAGAELLTVLIPALGLGLGCLVGGLLSRQRIAFMPLLALLAAAGAACAFLSPVSADSASGWSIAVAPFLGAFLMGVTLPLAIGHLWRRSGTVGSAFGEVLSAALLGAGAAFLACITVLFPFLGMRGSLDLAAAIHAAVALGALVIHWRNRRDTAQTGDAAAWRQLQIAFAPALALAAAAGLLSLAYALFFVRIVSYAITPNAAAFAATLGAFLIGLAAGARRAGVHCALFSADELMRRLARSAMAANLVGLAALPLLGQLAWLDRAVIVLAMLLCFLAARACGALIPYLAELGIPADARAGRRGALLCVGYVAGAATGALLTGLVLMERLSLVATGVLLVVTGVLFTLVLIATLDLPRWQKIVRSVTALAVGALALTLMPHWSANVVERLTEKGSAQSKPLPQTIGKHALGPSSDIAAPSRAARPADDRVAQALTRL